MSPRLASFGLGLAVGAAVIGLLLLLGPPRNQQANPNPAPVVEAGVPTSTNPKVSPESFDWRAVESEEYPEYIANLRAIGCPEETIRDIIIADVNKLFENRRKSLFGTKTNRLEYWKPWAQRRAQAFDVKRILAQQALAREKRAVIKTLLGVELEEKPELMTMTPLEEELDFLDPEKRNAIVELEQQFSAIQLQATLSGADVSELRRLEKEREKQREAQIAKWLSPEQLEDYRLRRSNTARRMTWELASFEPNEQEFREIFKLRSQVEDEFGLTRNDTLGSAATAKLEEGLKSLLGDVRYQEYERSQDSAYQAVYRVAEKNGFTKDAANRIFELKKAAEAQVSVARQDDSLTREQRSDALAAIRNEADRAAHTLFSHEAILALEGQGAWLGHIARPATPVQR
jgi:hypothetical protein